jgi:hypothetical protein
MGAANPLVVTWPQALAWRLERHRLARIDNTSIEEIVTRLCGIQSQVPSFAELAIRVRQSKSNAGDVSQALADGRLVKTWAMRATLHLLSPEDAGSYLALLAATKWWERPTWERYFGVSPKQIQQMRGIFREVVGDRALTREEVIPLITKHRGFEHLDEAMRSGWGTLFKPLAWQGDLVFGPNRGTRPTFMVPEAASSRWKGLPPLDEAWPRVLPAYVAAYGPAGPRQFSAWLSRGAIPMRNLKSWFGELQASGLLTEIDVEGETLYVRTADVDELARVKLSKQVRLLGGFDQWVLGPGTDDGHVTPKAQRRAVSRTAGWIAPVVLVGGVVRGTWELKRNHVKVEWFPEAGKPPIKAIESEVRRLSAIVGRDLTFHVAPAGKGT